MVSTYYPAAYIQVHFRGDVIMEVNTINPDQTASRESLIWLDIVRHKDYLRT